MPLFLVVYLLIYIPQIKKEEDMLSKRFGQDYKDYCRTASKYFPKICSSSNIKNIISLKFSWLKKELVPLIMAIIVIIAIETWQDVESFGFKEFSKEPLEFLLIILTFVIIIILFRKKNDSSW